MQDSNIKNIAKDIQLLICDVDGVLTKGEVFLDNNNLEMKSFNIKDGLGLKLLQRADIDIAIITGRQSRVVDRRMAELDIKHVYQGQVNKIAAYEGLLNKLDIKPSQVAYMGDDLPDLPLMQRSALGIAVADAHWFVKDNANWITFNDGGFGAVRDVADLILDAKNLLDSIHQEYLNQ